MQKRQGLVIALPVALLLFSGCGARGQAVRKYRSLGIAEMQKQNYEAAIDAFRHATDYYGTAQQGKYEDALTHYELLLQKDGRKAAYLDLACAAAVKADKGWDTALAYYEEAEKAGGDRALHLEALYLLGETARSKGSTAELETIRAAYEKAYPGAKEDSRFLLHYGDLLVSAKKTEEAFAVFEAGEKLTAANAEEQATFREREAVCQEYRGEYADALNRFTALLESGLGDKEMLEHEIAFLKTRVGGNDG